MSTTPLEEELMGQEGSGDSSSFYDSDDWGQADAGNGGSGLPWKRIITWVLILTVGGSVLLGLGLQLSGGGSSSGSSETAAVADPATDMQARSWQGAAFPVSDEHGPEVFTDTRASGFAQTPKGAALAALHIASRISPYNGPSVFQPTIQEQVTGDTSSLLTLMEGEYNKVAKENGLKNGEPLIRPTGQMLAWRLANEFSENRNTVDLYVKTPRATEVVYTVPVVWQDGDWKIERLADDNGLTFEVSEFNEADSSTFEYFIPTQN